MIIISKMADKLAEKGTTTFTISTTIGSFTTSWLAYSIYSIKTGASGRPLQFFVTLANYFGWAKAGISISPVINWFAEPGRAGLYTIVALFACVLFNLATAQTFSYRHQAPLYAWLLFAFAVQGSGWITTLATCIGATTALFLIAFLSEFPKNRGLGLGYYHCVRVLIWNLFGGITQGFAPITLLALWIPAIYNDDDPRPAQTENQRAAGAMNTNP